LQQSKKFDT
jgi:hypothetical protein